MDDDAVAPFFDATPWPTLTRTYDPKHSVTYGEVTADGARQIAALFDEATPFSHDNVFYDLGSGRGRLVLAMAATFSPRVLRASKGVELVTERHDVAQQAAVPAAGGVDVQFVNGSFLDDDVFDPADATWVYVSNLCFPRDVDLALAQKLGTSLRPGALVISSKQLEHPNLVFSKHVTIPQTWSASSPAYMYTQQRTPTCRRGGCAPCRAREELVDAAAALRGGALGDCYCGDEEIGPDTGPLVQFPCGHTSHAACAARLFLKDSITPQVEPAAQGRFIPHETVCPFCKTPVGKPVLKRVDGGLDVVVPLFSRAQYRPVLDDIGPVLERKILLEAADQATGSTLNEGEIHRLEKQIEDKQTTAETDLNLEGRIDDMLRSLLPPYRPDGGGGDDGGGVEESKEEVPERFMKGVKESMEREGSMRENAIVIDEDEDAPPAKRHRRDEAEEQGKDTVDEVLMTRIQDELVKHGYDSPPEEWAERFLHLKQTYPWMDDNEAIAALTEFENFAGGAVPDAVYYYLGHAPPAAAKKYVVVINGRRIYFGDRSVSDFTKTHDVARRNAYLKSHRPMRKNWTRAGVTTPCFWERWLLWNKPSKRESIRFLERALKVRIRPLKQ